MNLQYISICKSQYVLPFCLSPYILRRFLLLAKTKRIYSQVKFESFVSKVFITYIMKTLNETQLRSTLSKGK